jgi:hypothetical protein
VANDQELKDTGDEITKKSLEKDDIFDFIMRPMEEDIESNDLAAIK